MNRQMSQTGRIVGGAVGGMFGCFIVVLIINCTVGAICFDYILNFMFGKDIHWFGDMLCRLFLGEFTIPLAVICFVLNACGIEPPLFKSAVETAKSVWIG